MKLKFIIGAFLIIKSITAMAGSNVAEMDIKKGNWEITSQMQMQGPIKVETPPVTINKCFTKENMTPDRLMNNKHCEMKNMDIGANTVSWQMKCEQAGMQMEGLGELAYQKTIFDGQFKMTVIGSKEGAINVNTKLNGHYVGPCK
jgi:hypothetical protein